MSWSTTSCLEPTSKHATLRLANALTKRTDKVSRRKCCCVCCACRNQREKWAAISLRALIVLYDQSACRTSPSLHTRWSYGGTLNDRCMDSNRQIRTLLNTAFKADLHVSRRLRLAKESSKKGTVDREPLSCCSKNMLGLPHESKDTPTMHSLRNKEVPRRLAQCRGEITVPQIGDM